MLSKPRFETASDALRLRHSTDTGWMLHHPLALGDREADHPESEQPGDDARQRADPPLEQRDLTVVFAAARLHQ